MPEGIGYMEQVFGEGGPQIVMAYREGKQVTGQIFQWSSDAPYVCFAGTLDQDGLVVAGRSRIIAPLGDRIYLLNKGDTVGLNRYGPMRAPPPEKVAEIEQHLSAEGMTRHCREVLEL